MNTDRSKIHGSLLSSSNLISFHGHMVVKEEYDALMCLNPYIVTNNFTSESLLIITQNRLTQVSLAKISLSVLLQALPALKYLTHLSIESEEITTLENLPLSLCSLEYLELKCPNLVSLRGLPQSLTSLHSLTILSNKLLSFEGLLPQLPSLIYLSITDCPILDLGDSFRHSFALETLWIENASLKSLHGLPSKLDHLEELRVLNSAIESLEGLPSDLLALKICNIGIFSERGRIDFPKEKKKKILPFHSLKGFPQNVPLLEELAIVWTSLPSFQGLAPNLPRLRYLFVPGNQLVSLQGLPDTLESLLEFNLEGNHLVSLENCPPRLLNLEYFNCSYNYLLNFDHLPQFSVSLKTPYFAHNQFQSLSGLKERLLLEEKNLSVESLIEFESDESALTAAFGFPNIYMYNSTIKSLHSVSIPALYLNLYRIGFFNRRFSKGDLPRLNLTMKGYALVEKNISFLLSHTNFESLSKLGEIPVYALQDDSGLSHFINQELITELFNYYYLSPLELAYKYVSSKPLTDDEMGRLLHEADIPEMEVLMEYLQPDDYILCQVQNRISNERAYGTSEKKYPLWFPLR